MADLVKMGKEIRREIFGPETLSESLAPLIFGNRLEKGLTQKQLAEKANVSPSIIYRIEGGSDVLISDYEKVAKALDISKRDIGQFLSEVEE